MSAVETLAVGAFLAGAALVVISGVMLGIGVVILLTMKNPQTNRERDVRDHVEHGCLLCFAGIIAGCGFMLIALTALPNHGPAR